MKKSLTVKDIFKERQILNHGDGCSSECQCRITSDYVLLPEVAVLGNSGEVKFNKILICCDMKLKTCEDHFTVKRHAMALQNKLQLVEYIQEKIKNNMEQVDGFLDDMNGIIEEISALVESCNDKGKNK